MGRGSIKVDYSLHIQVITPQQVSAPSHCTNMLEHRYIKVLASPVVKSRNVYCQNMNSLMLEIQYYSRY